MKAEEVYAMVDEEGILHVDKLNNFKNKKVKLIVLSREDDDISDEDWIKFLASNRAFDFLKDEEDIYTIHDGKPYNSER